MAVSGNVAIENENLTTSLGFICVKLWRGLLIFRK